MQEDKHGGETSASPKTTGKQKHDKRGGVWANGMQGDRNNGSIHAIIPITGTKHIEITESGWNIGQQHPSYN